MFTLAKAYGIKDNGEITPADVQKYEDLDSAEVFIIVDDRHRKIHIWKGEGAPVRKKFISARSAQKMRLDLGMTYNIVSEDAGSESKAFTDLMGGDVEAGAPPSVAAAEPETSGPLYTGETAAPKAAPTPTAAPKAAPTVTAAPKAAPTVTSAPKAVPTVISAPKATPIVTSAPKAAPTVTSAPKPTTAVKPAPKAVAAPTPRPAVPTGPIDVQAIEEKLKDIGEPEGMLREIVIAGDQVYSVMKVHQALFNIDVARLEPMEGLPPGTFPAAEYYPRIYIDEKGQVMFIELFREAPADEREEFVSEMKRSLTDLSKLGI